MNQKGFTLIEVLVVIIILGVLATIGTPMYTGFVKDAMGAEAIAAIDSVITAEKVYFQKNNTFVSADGHEAISQDLNVDMSDIKNFTCSVDGDAANFTVTCKVSQNGVERGLPPSCEYSYIHDTKESAENCD